LVTPFGLLYLILKYWTDRYNAYFAYAPCKVNKEVHGTAVNFVIICMFMLQVNLLVYVHFHLGGEHQIHPETEQTKPEVRALQVFSLLGFSVTAALFLGQLCFNVCADISPIHHFKSISHDNAARQDQEDEEESQNPGGKKLKSKTPSEDLSSSSHHEIKKGLSVPRLGPKGSFSEPPLKAKKKSVDGGVEVERGPKKIRSATQNAADNKSVRHPRSDSLGSGYSSRPYGRYIPPLLRQEFIRSALASGHSRKTDPDAISTTSKTSKTRDSHM